MNAMARAGGRAYLSNATGARSSGEMQTRDDPPDECAIGAPTSTSGQPAHHLTSLSCCAGEGLRLGGGRTMRVAVVAAAIITLGALAGCGTGGGGGLPTPTRSLVPSVTLTPSVELPTARPPSRSATPTLDRSPTRSLTPSPPATSPPSAESARVDRQRSRGRVARRSGVGIRVEDSRYGSSSKPASRTPAVTTTTATATARRQPRRR